MRHCLSRDDLASAPFAGGTILGRGDPKLRNRLTIALDADKELLPQRLLALLSRVEPEADRAFIAHNLCSLYRQLSWILHRHDRMGMAASMEMRVPFLENEMFDFAFHLPRRATLHPWKRNPVRKWVVKNAAARILPADIVHAPKKGFPMPGVFTRGTQRLIDGGMLAEVLEWPANTIKDIVELLGQDELLRFQIVGLEMWARIFFDGEAPAALGEKLTALATKVTPNRARRPSRLKQLGRRIRYGRFD